MRMRISQTLVDAVKGFEGLRLEAYRCPSGVWTIGYGHTSGVTQGMKVNEGWAESALKQDLNEVMKHVERLGLPLNTQGQIDSVVDFVFNLGITKFKQSTLRKRIAENAGDDAICAEFKKWVFCTQNGKNVKLPGLVKRREWECKRWISVI